MNQRRPVSVLLAPLDWGLGHATRCIPIIKELNNQGARVMIAASGSQKTLLNEEFPLLEFIEIPGYEMRYKRGYLLKLGLLLRIPVILKQIKKENKWLERVIENREIIAVISDNRYGLFHKKLYSVFITHQLYIQSGWGAHKNVGRLSRHFAGAVGRWIDKKIMRWNYKFIAKFSVCWVPDLEENNSLAGKLSHPGVFPPIPVKYIGILSRLKKEEKRIIKNSLLVLLSGPEPHRTDFENILLEQLVDSTMETVVVRGLPGKELSVPIMNEGIKIYNHLPADRLNELLSRSEYIIARSGYSTIMDLARMQRNAILVPTPGQTEQEYLARYLHEKNWMFNVSQKRFNLKNVLSTFKKMEMKLPEIPESNLYQLVKDFLMEISQGDKQ
jgi:UDP:flavonoid glycosyltransferase YjiC (YdhE family)